MQMNKSIYIGMNVVENATPKKMV